MEEVDYRIETLGHIFGQHSDKYEESHKEHLKKYPESQGIEFFNLSKALSVMACEIEKLRHHTGCK